MITIGNGGRREIEDVLLSRYACYLIVQNADPSKADRRAGPDLLRRANPAAGAGRRAGRADRGAKAALPARPACRPQPPAGRRGQPGRRGAGHRLRHLPGPRLHGPLWRPARPRHPQRKGLKHSQQILDHMGSTELAANLFRATQTEEKLRREGVQGKDAANRTHYEVGRMSARRSRSWAARCPRTCRPRPRASSNCNSKSASAFNKAINSPCSPTGGAGGRVGRALRRMTACARLAAT